MKTKIIQVLFVWCSVTIGLSSCQRNNHDDHPENFGRFFSEIDTTAFSKQLAIFDSLDYLIHHLPAGDGDKAEYYRRKANYNIRQLGYLDALPYLDSLAVITEKRQSEERFKMLQFEQLTVRSDCYAALKKTDLSLKTLLKARLLIPMGDCDGLGVDARIGDMLYGQKRFLLAAEYYRSAFDVEKICQKDTVQIVINSQRYLDNIALCYMRSQIMDSAIFYYHKTLDYINEHVASYPRDGRFVNLARAVVNANLGETNMTLGNYEQAEALLLSSINATEKDYVDFTMSTRLLLASLYIKWDKIDMAFPYLKKTETAFKKNIVRQPDWLLAMKRYWEKKNDLKTAMFYNNRYLKFRDSIDLLDRRDISRDLGREFESMEQKAINEKLEITNKENSFRLLIAILTALLIAIVAIFVLYNSRTTSRNLKKLQALNKEIEQKNIDLRRAFSSLEESQEDNTRLIRTVAHDLRNPIGGIRTVAHSLIKNEKSAEVRSMLELIYTAATNCFEMIKDLVREKNNSVSYKKESIELGNLIKYCADLMQTKAKEKNQKLSVNIEENIRMTANGEKIWRVVSNLLGNAIKFSPENKAIAIILEKKSNSILLTIRDEGIGIPLDLQDKIFNDNYDSSRMGTAGEESHGLGLSITRQIVAEHNGKIWFESMPGQGTTFYVELPLAA